MAPRRSSSSCSKARASAYSATKSSRCDRARSSDARRGRASSHAFRGPITLLTYGTREPNDICYYPRSKKIGFWGVGVIARVESLDYWDGEPPG